MNTRVFLLFATAVVVLLVSGCGGGADSQAGADSNEITIETGSLSKAQFIKRAEAICQKTRDRFDREISQRGITNALASATAAAKVINTIFVPNYEKLTDQIAALGAPSGDEEEVAAFLNTMQQKLDSASEEPLKTVRRGAPLREAAKLAAAYGLDECVNSFS